MITAAGILIGGLIMTSCSKPPKAPPQAGPPEVGFMTVQPQRVAITTELSGKTTASMVAEVRPQVGGIIQKRLYTEGSDVKAGAVLYQIDPASYQAAFAGAKAVLAKAEANLVASWSLDGQIAVVTTFEGLDLAHYGLVFLDGTKEPFDRLSEVLLHPQAVLKHEPYICFSKGLSRIR